MALWKRESDSGQISRYRVPLRTRREALVLEKKAIAEAGRGKLTTSGQRFARLAFSEPQTDIYPSGWGIWPHSVSVPSSITKQQLMEVSL